MRVGLMVPTLAFTGDAVGRDVIGMYHSLASMGHTPIIYTWSVKESGGIRTEPYHSAKSLRGSDLLIYHYCTGDLPVLDTVSSLKCRIAIKYHNVTPSEFFEGYSPDFVDATKRARVMLPKFVKIPGLHGIADSEFNRDELVSLGMSSVAVVPPFHQTSELLDAAPPKLKSSNCLNVLSVGRIAPNKGLEQAISAFLEAAAASSVPMHMDIVGRSDERILGYKDRLVALVGEHKNVKFIESASAVELSSLYRHADAYLTASEHEGFCVPVVEAMAFGVHVISGDKGALPETCGNAAVICKDHADFVRALLDIGNRSNATRAAGLARYHSIYSESATRLAFAAVISNIAPNSHLVTLKAIARLVRRKAWRGWPGVEVQLRNMLRPAKRLYEKMT